MLVALVALVAFWPASGYGFLDWDDYSNFRDNPDFQGLGWRQIRWAWTTRHLGVYQPVAWMLLSLQSAAWGLNPRGYHLVNLLLYAVNAVVLYILVLALLRRGRVAAPGEDPGRLSVVAALATALFVAHPLRTEVVAWVSCQPYIPCVLFAMLAVLAYLRAHPESGPLRPGWAAAAFVLFAASLLSKAPAVMLPLVLLVLDIDPLRRLGGGPGRWLGRASWGVWLEKLPYLALSAVAMALAVQAKEESRTLFRSPLSQGTLASRLAQACFGAGFYLAKTIWPVGITAYYPLPRTVSWTDPRFALAGLLVVGVSLALLLLALARHWRAPLAAWACYLLILAPSSGLLRFGGQAAADRYSYLAMIGMVPLLATGLLYLLRWPRARAGVIAIGLSALLALTALSRHQCRTWSSSVALWQHAMAHSPEPDSFLYNALGRALYWRDGPAAGRPYFVEAVRIDPASVEAHFQLGTTALRLDRLDEAEAELAQAVRLDPYHPKAHYHLGVVQFHRKRADRGAAHFAEAIRLDPGNVEAHTYLGIIRSTEGKSDEAIAHLREAVRLRPDSADARANLGIELIANGQLAAGESELAEALRLDPGHTRARHELEALARKKGGKLHGQSDQ